MATVALRNMIKFELLSIQGIKLNVDELSHRVDEMVYKEQSERIPSRATSSYEPNSLTKQSWLSRHPLWHM